MERPLISFSIRVPKMDDNLWKNNTDPKWYPQGLLQKVLRMHSTCHPNRAPGEWARARRCCKWPRLGAWPWRGWFDGLNSAAKSTGIPLVEWATGGGVNRLHGYTPFSDTPACACYAMYVYVDIFWSLDYLGDMGWFWSTWDLGVELDGRWHQLINSFGFFLGFGWCA